MKLTSLQNPKVKNIVKLRDRRQRDKQGKTLLEGYRLISRAIESNFKIDECFYCPSLYLGSNETKLLDDLSATGALTTEVTEDVFKKMTYRDRPEGLLAISPIPKHDLTDLPVDSTGLYLVVEAIEKPGNLGSILRSADGSGVKGLILCDKCTDLYNPNVLTASTGAIYNMPIAECSSSEALEWLKKFNIKTLATTPHTDTTYDQINMTSGIAIIVGTEQVGLSDFWLNESDIKTVIPMEGKADSLNVAIATSILLFEASRQRRNITSK